MEFIEITENNKKEYNAVVTHPLQSYEWGEFRKKTGVKVLRRGLLKDGKLIDGFTLTLHKIPKTKFMIGYLPKGNGPTKEVIAELKRIGKEEGAIMIQLEPNVLKSATPKTKELRPSFHPLFTRFTFVLDISKPEEELLKSFHSKTRYNIRLAEKKGVKITEEHSEKAFKKYLDLTKETTTRQKFYAHTPTYHTLMWETLSNKENELKAHLLHATFEKETLATWILFSFHDTLYYPYGASSSKHRNVMASNSIMWEAIKFGKKLDLKFFDMWGALGTNPNISDPWYGFHKFKEGYGATHTEFAGSFDLVINPALYEAYKIADKTRWVYLRLKKLRG